MTTRRWLSGSLVSREWLGPERLVFSVDVSQNSQVEAESEQNLPGEDALLALIDLHDCHLPDSLAAVLQSGFMVDMLGRE